MKAEYGNELPLAIVLSAILYAQYTQILEKLIEMHDIEGYIIPDMYIPELYIMPLLLLYIEIPILLRKCDWLQKYLE